MSIKDNHRLPQNSGRMGANMDENCTWSRKNHSIFENFAIGLQEFWKCGKKADRSSGMLRVSLEKQREAMKKTGLHMTYELVPNGHLAKDSVKFGWKDDVFSNSVECRTCSMTRKIYRGQERIYTQKENVSLYVTITDLLHKQSVRTDQLYNCPNCGAASTIAQLEEKCPYCGTCFRISELFPVVTNFYTVREISGTEKEIRKRFLRYGIPAMLFCILISFISGIKKDPEIGIFLNLLGSVFLGGLIGLLVGYLIFALVTLGTALKEAGKAMPMLWASRGSRKRFVNTVRQYSPEFSYEFFTDKVVAILRQLLAEERLEDNPYYIGIGAPSDIDGASIIEYGFRGPVALKSCRMDGKRCNVLVDVYMTDYYWKNDRIKKKDDVFRLSLTKDLSKRMNYSFSLSAIRCRNCGGSFDASREKKCPYCGTEYQIADDDWVVTSVRKR